MKKILLSGVVALLSTSALAQIEYKPLCVENRTWIYSEFYFGRPQKLQHKVLKIKDTSEINGKTYHNCYAYDYDNPASSLSLVAYLREEDGKVYMLKKNSSAWTTLRKTYGSENIETLIYDFSIEEGDTFQVGEDKYYDNGEVIYFDLLRMATDNGRIRCVSTENISQNKFYPDTKQLELEFVAPEKDSYKYNDYEQYLANVKFIIREGVGLLSSFSYESYAVMGYFPFPYYEEMSSDWETMIDLLYVCDDGDFNKVIYRQDGLPENPQEYFDTLGVDDVVADGDASPEYYNIQGMKVANPQEGEIYIVKRGARASKEVYRR